ncbi:aminodeoxychorismate synthase component I [Clostridium grantii]|uniref:aminodeoxychorismate synthase n=1 Tax=Clostridium grantii DSM 8605 TaxID=1121316 RepID=A0A1M5QJ67_9CLOT|nr:aminodeoxychorismate synthase component I [Clostridium grantii]SHH13839.1 aminodeoxychorismate synthase, subunit I [Clostridium grantii DSM 8605]
MKIKIKEIETKLTSFQLFEIFKNDEYVFFLDSGMDHDKLGRYSFISSNPLLVFKSKGNEIKITKKDQENIFFENPFEKLKEILKKYTLSYKTPFPFIGGVVGYFGYDMYHHLENINTTAIDDMNIPDCVLGVYDGVIIVDHLENKVFIAALGMEEDCDKVLDTINNRININTDKIMKETQSIIDKGLTEEIYLQSNLNKKDYITCLKKVKNYIEEGDVYQVNLTQRFQCHINETSFDIYKRLRKINPAPFASYFDFKEGQIVSSSPERFIKIQDKVIETRPIKGTIPRGKTQEEDNKNKEILLNSEKDKAELLMIVDLERNDLGKICKTGTVKVTELFHLEKYATVYHLVSTIKGEIKDEYDVVDCLKATFPGGSITGAPKIRAMEIIDEIEPNTRNIYTGSIGYIGFNGDVDLNIVIRTIVCKGNKASFGVGGGIVWDSDSELEYEESLHKAKALIKTLNGGE